MVRYPAAATLYSKRKAKDGDGLSLSFVSCFVFLFYLFLICLLLFFFFFPVLFLDLLVKLCNIVTKTKKPVNALLAMRCIANFFEFRFLSSSFFLSFVSVSVFFSYYVYARSLFCLFPIVVWR
jgi:hypothetical protein